MVLDIDNIMEEQAKEEAEECLRIKGHDVYLTEIEEYYGYSALVFKDGKYIRYSSDFGLHHSRLRNDKNQLRQYYIERMNRVLFEDGDISEPLQTYEEYLRKMEYLVNSYPLRVDSISEFQCFHNDEEEKEFFESINGMVYDPVGYCYVKDVEFVKKHINLMNSLQEQQKAKKNDYDYFKSAFMYEMNNHEYVINWQGDYDVFSVFGNVEYSENIEDYFRQLNFTDTMKKAFMDARREYLKRAEEAV